MTVAKSSSRSRFSRPTIMRPMRAVRLGPYDPLDRWLAVADISSERHLRITPLPNDEVMFEVFVCPIEVYFVSLR